MRNIYNLEGRSKAIVILKCLAALLITISHLDVIFPNGFKWMATGGALGDSLFFFCSGFTLFLGRDGGFANWYKRRISRIYPAVFIWGVIATVFYAQDWLVTDVLAAKGLWFLSCIMIYYIIIYAIYHLLKKHLNIIFIIAFIIAFAAGYLIIDTSHVTMYGSSKYIRVFYFIFMLLGTITAININKIVGGGLKYSQISVWKSCLSFVISMGAYYGFLYLCKINATVCLVQALSLIPLLLAVWFLFQLCNTESASKIFNKAWLGNIVYVLSALTLEIYIVQRGIISAAWLPLFPFNIPLILCCIVVLAYVVHCLANLFMQIFAKEDINWRKVFMP